MPVPQSVINIMNKEAGQQHVEFTDKVFTTDELQIEAEATHNLTYIPRLPVTTEEAMIVDFPADGLEDTGVPELRYYDDGSDSESSDSVDDQDDLDLDQTLEELEKVLEDSEDSLEPKDGGGVTLGQTKKSTAGHRTYDTNYEWSLMNLI